LLQSSAVTRSAPPTPGLGFGLSFEDATSLAPSSAQPAQASAPFPPRVGAGRVYQLLQRALGNSPCENLIEDIYEKLSSQLVDWETLQVMTSGHFSELGIKFGATLRIRRELAALDPSAQNSEPTSPSFTANSAQAYNQGN
jgi:hypothetical protein